MKTDDPIFTDLALKVLANKASAEERSQLDALLAKEVALKTEFEEMRKDYALAKGVLPLMGEDPAEAPPLPDFIRNQLRATVRQLAEADERDHAKSPFPWRWLWGLATATVVIAVVVVLNLPAQKTAVQFAMLDSMGAMRGGTNDVVVKLESALQENFGQTNFTTCSGSQELNQWLNQWPASGQTFKLIYDRDNAEVRILSRVNGSTQILKTFPVTKEADLSAVLKQASEVIQQLSKSKQ